MKTIDELLIIEQEYIEERINEIENIDFIKILQEENLTNEEFQYKKGEYYLKTFNPLFAVGEVRSDTNNFVSNIAKKKINSIVCVLPTQRMVWHPVDAEFNREYCKTHNILCKERPYLGGVLCILPTDLTVTIVAVNAPTTFSKVIIDKVANWIKSKILNTVEISGNDILVDGFKVFGMAGFNFKDVTACSFHLAFDSDLDFIQQICTKEMVKVPNGLNSFGIFDRDDLITEMMSWLK